MLREKARTSFMNGIRSALETNPGTSFDVVTSIPIPRLAIVENNSGRPGNVPFPQATANALARSSVSWDVCSAEISSTNF